MPVIAGLFVYPVKGLRGVALPMASVERCGLRHDRRWAVLRSDGRVLTQRELPEMARVDAFEAGTGVRLQAAGHGGVDAVPAGPARRLTIWGAQVPVATANGEASEWLARVLGVDCALAYLADPAIRPVAPGFAQAGDVVSLADGFPLLLAANESLAALNERLATPVGMDRFRPNLVIEGAPAWAEDKWAYAQAGAVRLRLPKPCARCAVVTVDQQTGARAPRNEPLRTLAQLRRGTGGEIAFGWNAVPETLGELRVGDEISPAPAPGAA